MPIAIAVHGGAWNIPDDAVAPSRDGVRTAMEAAWSRLRDGARALDAVELAVRHLEDDPHFDAGVGAVLATCAGASAAARAALLRLDRVGGRGGLIVVDRSASRGIAFNTPRMARAWADERTGPHAAVGPDDAAP